MVAVTFLKSFAVLQNDYNSFELNFNTYTAMVSFSDDEVSLVRFPFINTFLDYLYQMFSFTN